MAQFALPEGDSAARASSLFRGTTDALGLPLIEQAEDRIGPYKLLQRIGEGGCGVVYMAEQGVPVRRRVALKLIKPGMDSRAVIARFEAERQALAMMDHPNIAKVLDVGETSSGRPYFVMELVRGIPITEYCDKNQLSPEERLELFVLVCHAVQHAHQKGVIHRDLKPANVLVTVGDEQGIPKVIDFGIAKAIEGKLTDKTLFTVIEQFIGTPAYMSPEQAEMTRLDIDSRTDIYSLGVLLYELLTGQTPFDSRELLSAGLDEMRRTLRDRDPDTPSARLKHLPNNHLIEIAKLRATAPARLSSALCGDLDWIVMKALEKDRTRRYATANGLAADVRRHLQHELVEARPPSTWYWLQKTARRNRGAFVGVVSVVVALVLGLGISLHHLVRERLALRKSEQVVAFMKDMLKSVKPSVALGKDPAMMLAVLRDTTARVDRELQRQPEVQVELFNLLGSVYQEMDEYPLAMEMHRKAVTLAEESHVEGWLKADSLMNYANTLIWNGKHSEAKACLEQALVLARRGDPRARGFIGKILYYQANVEQREGHWEEAQRLFQDAERQLRATPGAESDLADLLTDLAVNYHWQKLDAKSEATAQEALRLQMQLHPMLHPSIAITLQTIGVAMEAQGRYAEAEAYFRRDLELTRKIVGPNHEYILRSLPMLTRVLLKQQRFQDAEGLARERLGLLLGHTGADVDQADAKWTLGAALAGQRQFRDAEPLLLAGYSVLASNLPPTRRRELTQTIQGMYTDWKKPEKAREWKQRVDAMASTAPSR